MNSTIGLAGSRGRIALVTVESIERYGKRGQQKIVRAAAPLDTTDPREVRAAVIAATADVLSDPDNLDGDEPRVVVSYGVGGGAVFELLREDYRAERRRRRPTGITVVSSLSHPQVEHVAATRLASKLYTEHAEGRIDFAKGLAPELKKQMTSFVPVESKAGNLSFGNEDLEDYDHLVVALMHAVIAAGQSSYGLPRYEDHNGLIWPSREMAVVRLRGAEG